MCSAANAVICCLSRLQGSTPRDLAERGGRQQVVDMLDDADAGEL